MPPRRVLLGSVLAAAPVAAMAQPIQGLYVGAGAGYGLPQAIRATPSSPDFGAGHLRLEQDGGLAAIGRLGYALGNGFRFEVEGDFLRNGIRELGRTPFPTAASGRLRTTGVMVNAVYGYDIGCRYVFPYLGVGVGYMRTRMDSVSFVEPGGPFGFSATQSAGKFA